VVQLRHGCDSPKCSTATCFSCRKRLAGKAPIRRYNPTSARTLAVYLASQDNPDKGLCPYLRRSKEPPAATNTLIFGAKFPSPPSQSQKRQSHVSAPVKRAPKAADDADTAPARRRSSSSPRRHCNVSTEATSGSGRDPKSHLPAARPDPKLSISERPATKDHRSFAATVFGTAAFKMLEWLTPQGIDHISRSLRDVSDEGTAENAEGFDTTTVHEVHATPPVAKRSPPKATQTDQHERETSGRRAARNGMNLSCPGMPLSRPEAPRAHSELRHRPNPSDEVLWTPRVYLLKRKTSRRLEVHR